MLDNKIHSGSELYLSLLKSIISNPGRYSGIFRISNAKTKLIQSVTQSNEIKFGDFMEEIVRLYIEREGFTNLNRKLSSEVNGESLSVDQLFLLNSNTICIIEQKIRDDHDSTKKRGQYENFAKKIAAIRQIYPREKIVAVMWFIDDSLKKNSKFYILQANTNIISNCDQHILYGSDLFKQIIGSPISWDELTGYLTQNKIERSNSVLEIPDFDTSEEILEALNSLTAKEKKKLLSSKSEFVMLRKELFPKDDNIKKIKL